MSLKKCSLKGCVMENETSRHGAEGINGPQYHAQCAVIALRTERDLADRLAVAVACWDNSQTTDEINDSHKELLEAIESHREARG